MRLGDTVFSIPAVKKIREFYPEDSITVMCYPESELIYKLAFDNIDFHPVEKSNFILGRRFANNAVRKQLSSLNPKIIFDLTCSVTSASLIFTSSAREIIGCSEYFFRGIYTKNVSIRNTPHLMDHYLDVVSLVSDFPRTQDIYEYKLNFDSTGYILIHPLSVRKAKEWNLNKYISLAESLMKDYDVKFIIPDHTLGEDIIQAIREKRIPVQITSSLNELIDIIRNCSLYVSNDTGPLYIANLLGKPTFTIYGPSNPEYSKPFGQKHRQIKKVIGCSPLKDQSCFTLAGVDCNHYDCMNLLQFSEVEQEVLGFISELGITPKLNAVEKGG